MKIPLRQKSLIKSNANFTNRDIVEKRKVALSTTQIKIVVSTYQMVSVGKEAVEKDIPNHVVTTLTVSEENPADISMIMYHVIDARHFLIIFIIAKFARKVIVRIAQ